jgi:hypothetical protein
VQRMKLHLSGVKVPKLGSLQDRVYRDYMTRESQLEAEKMTFIMMQTMMIPTFDNQGKAREWSEKVKRVWSNYLALQYGLEISEHTEKELQMMEYYQSVVKHLKPTLEKNKDGNYNVKGLDQLKR